MNMKRGAWRGMWAAPLAMVLLVLTLAPVACGSDSEPEDVELDLEISDGSLDLESNVIKVKQDDNVTFRIKSDVEGGFHLHGYDLVEDVAPNSTATMSFVADATGNFSIMLHLFAPEEEMSGEPGMEQGESAGEHEEGEAEHDDGEHSEEEEVVALGSLEVHPR